MSQKEKKNDALNDVNFQASQECIDVIRNYVKEKQERACGEQITMETAPLNTLFKCSIKNMKYLRPILILRG